MDSYVRNLSLMIGLFCYSYGSSFAEASPISHSSANCLKVEGTLPRLECSDYEAHQTYLAIEKLLNSGKIEEGLSLLQMLVDAKPFSIEFRKKLIEKKIEFLRIESLHNDIIVLEKLNPGSPSVAILKARTLNAQGKIDEAVGVLSLELQANANQPEIRRLRAQIHEKNGNWAQAKTDWQILERVKAPPPELIHRLTVALKAREFEDIRKVVESTPTKDSRLRFLLAQAYFGLGRYAEAIDLTKDLLSAEPDNQEFRLILAKSLIEISNYDLAEQHLAVLLLASPQDFAAIYQLSRAYILQKRFYRAGQLLAQVSEVDPKNAWAIKAQAEIWNQLGETQLAKSTLASGSIEEGSLRTSETQTESRSVSSLPAACTEHLVKAGETLESISLLYYQSRQAWAHILDVNGIQDPNKIREGMVLLIPSSEETGKCGK